MDDSCAVCVETLKWVAYGACGHQEVCSTCVARLHFICNYRRCCICKTESNVVFVTKTREQHIRRDKSPNNICTTQVGCGGLILADKSGLNPETLLDVLGLGAIANPMFKMKGSTMNQKSYFPAFPLKHQQKDMRLALALGDQNEVSMPVAAIANEGLNSELICCLESFLCFMLVCWSQ